MTLEQEVIALHSENAALRAESEVALGGAELHYRSRGSESIDDRAFQEVECEGCHDLGALLEQHP